MAEEVATPTAPVEESFNDFFKAGNAAEAAERRGESEPVVDTSPAVAEETPTEEQATEPDATKKADGRTLEGRRQKQYTKVEEATAARREAERELASLNAQIEQRRTELTRQTPPQQAAPQQTAPQEDAEPQLEQFAKLKDGSENPDPYTSWLRATQRWEARQAARETERRMLAGAEAAQEHRSWESKIEAAEQAAPGLREKLRTATVPIHRDTIPYIKRHEKGAEIAAYLVDHPDIAQRLVTLHPVEQIGQIGEIVGELKTLAHAAKSGSAAPTRPVSQAKAPIQPLGTSPVASAAEPGDDESFGSFFRRNNAADRKAGRL